MPFVMLLFGATLAISAYKGTTEDLFALLQKDFTGDTNFLYWMASVAGVGLIGYVPGLQNFSRLIFILLLIVVLVSNKGIFAQFAMALQTSSSATNTASVTDDPEKNAQFVQWTPPGGAGGTTGADGGGSDIGSTIATVAPILLALL